MVTCGGALEVGVPLLDTKVVALAARDQNGTHKGHHKSAIIQW